MNFDQAEEYLLSLELFGMRFSRPSSSPSTVIVTRMPAATSA